MLEELNMIYPLNETIEKLLASAVDEETGELVLTEEELAAKIEAAEIEFDDKIKALRNSYLTDRMNAECVAAEASALYKLQQETSNRAKALENKANRTKRFIAYLLKGEKYNKDGVKVSYINRQNVEYDDGFVEWATHNAPGLLYEPEIRKKEVEAALKAGHDIKCAHLEQKRFITVK